MTAPSANRGAVLVHVAVVLLILLGVSALTIDLGVMWLSRGQAQNAADAGAYAGAISLAFDDGNDKSPAGPAVTKAVATANQNSVFGQPAGVTPADVTFPTCPNDGTDTCVRVNVYRNQTRGNALPVFFARLFGVTDQGVQAMAIAQAGFGNSAKCLKPWAIPDKWDENYPADVEWDWTNTFDLYDTSGNPIAPPDRYNGTEYLTMTDLNPLYTGFKASPPWPGPGDIGTQVRLKMGSPHDAPTPGWFQPIDLPVSGPDTGGARYRSNIANCNPNTYQNGDDLTVEPGNMIGPTRQGVNDLLAKDPDSYWDAASKSVQCPPGGNCTGERLVSIPVYDPYWYETNRHSGRVEIKISKVMGFFVVGMDGNDVLGYFVGAPAIDDGTTPGDQSSWMRVIRLVR